MVQDTIYHRIALREMSLKTDEKRGVVERHHKPDPQESTEDNF